MNALIFLIACWAISFSDGYKNYTGHKVISAVLKSNTEIEIIRKLRSDYSVDLWNEPRTPGSRVMMRLKPHMIQPVENFLKRKAIEYDVAFQNLQSAIDEERNEVFYSPSVHANNGFNFGKYHEYEEIIDFLKDLSSKHPDLARLEIIGKSYEHRPLYNLKISSGDSLKKPAILIDCGIHPREWSSVAAGSFMVNKLLTQYGKDDEVTSLVDKYEFNVILLANPDGYVYTWKQDRLWRKTRSRSRFDFIGVCIGTDANRNFEIDHCGPGTSRKPCDETYCGDKPFSESETRAIRDLMLDKKDRIVAYFSLHAFGQYWMTPYGITKTLPEAHEELMRVGQIGVDALKKRNGAEFELGTIANLMYEATGSSIDYAYEVVGIKMSFSLELRDRGLHGFILPPKTILPMSEETYDGVMASIKALKE